MKTTILLLLLSLSVCGQVYPPYPLVRLCKVQQDTICAGDSLTIYFLFWPSGLANTTDTTQIEIEDNTNHISTAWRGDYHYFNTLKKDTCQYATQFIGKDSATVMKLKIRSDISFPLNFSGNGISRMGAGRVLTSQDVFGFNYKNCSPDTTSPTHPITTGIQTYSMPDESPIYFDLQGNKIDLRYDELIIEQIGRVRKKVIYQFK